MTPFRLNNHPTGWPNDSLPILIALLIPIFMHNIYICFTFFQIYFGSATKIQPPKLSSQLRRLLMPLLAKLFWLFLYTIYIFMKNFFRILLRKFSTENFLKSRALRPSLFLTSSSPAVRYPCYFHSDNFFLF